METTLMNEEWDLLTTLLSEGWRDLAKSTDAVRCARGEITSPDVLLQVLLMHVSTGLSLQQAAARAKVQGLATITDVALLKRLRTSEKWLQTLAGRVGTPFIFHIHRGDQYALTLEKNGK